jgi:MYXO-CTERM domain-containing protein
VGAPCAAGDDCPTPEPTTSVCSPPSWGGIVYRGEANANGGPVYAPEGGYDSIGLDSSSASDDGKDAEESSSDDSGCQVGGARPAHLGLLGLLGLAWLVRRRRQG